jgi:probable HAF family extracellular repeat protein
MVHSPTWTSSGAPSSQLAAFSDANNFVHAFLTKPGGTAPKDLGINSEAFAINDLGEVAGNSWPATSPPVTPHAFLYSRGKMHPPVVTILSVSKHSIGVAFLLPGHRFL